MTSVLYRIARFCTRHHIAVLALWLVAAIALVVVSHRLGDQTNDNLSLPGTDSQRAADTLARSFPDQANGTSPIVLHAHSGKLSEAKYATAVDEAAAGVAREPHVASVVNPLTPQGASALSKDQATGYLSVTLSESPANCQSKKHSGSSTARTRRKRPDCRSRPAASWGRSSRKLRPSRAS